MKYLKKSKKTNTKFIWNYKTNDGAFFRRNNTEKQKNEYNTLRNQIGNDLNKLREEAQYTDFSRVQYQVHAGDVLSSVAYGFDRSATAKWKSQNPDIKTVVHSQKEININKSTKVKFPDGTSINLGEITTNHLSSNPNHHIHTGQFISFEKSGDKTVILVQKKASIVSVATENVSATDSTADEKFETTKKQTELTTKLNSLTLNELKTVDLTKLTSEQKTEYDAIKTEKELLKTQKTELIKKIAAVKNQNDFDTVNSEIGKYGILIKALNVRIDAMNVVIGKIPMPQSDIPNKIAFDKWTDMEKENFSELPEVIQTSVTTLGSLFPKSQIKSPEELWGKIERAGDDWFFNGTEGDILEITEVLKILGVTELNKCSPEQKTAIKDLMKNLQSTKNEKLETYLKTRDKDINEHSWTGKVYGLYNQKITERLKKGTGLAQTFNATATAFVYGVERGLQGVGSLIALNLKPDGSGLPVKNPLPVWEHMIQGIGTLIWKPVETWDTISNNLSAIHREKGIASSTFAVVDQISELLTFGAVIKVTKVGTLLKKIPGVEKRISATKEGLGNVKNKIRNLKKKPVEPSGDQLRTNGEFRRALENDIIEMERSPDGNFRMQNEPTPEIKITPKPRPSIKEKIKKSTIEYGKTKVSNLLEKIKKLNNKFEKQKSALEKEKSKLENSIKKQENKIKKVEAEKLKIQEADPLKSTKIQENLDKLKDTLKESKKQETTVKEKLNNLTKEYTIEEVTKINKKNLENLSHETLQGMIKKGAEQLKNDPTNVELTKALDSLTNQLKKSIAKKPITELETPVETPKVNRWEKIKKWFRKEKTTEQLNAELIKTRNKLSVAQDLLNESSFKKLRWIQKRNLKKLKKEKETLEAKIKKRETKTTTEPIKKPETPSSKPLQNDLAFQKTVDNKLNSLPKKRGTNGTHEFSHKGQEFTLEGKNGKWIAKEKQSGETVEILTKRELRELKKTNKRSETISRKPTYEELKKNDILTLHDTNGNIEITILEKKGNMVSLKIKTPNRPIKKTNMQDKRILETIINKTNKISHKKATP